MVAKVADDSFQDEFLDIDRFYKHMIPFLLWYYATKLVPLHKYIPFKFSNKRYKKSSK